MNQKLTGQTPDLKLLAKGARKQEIDSSSRTTTSAIPSSLKNVTKATGARNHLSTKTSSSYQEYLRQKTTSH